jgi:hypothetical protein
MEARVYGTLVTFSPQTLDIALLTQYIKYHAYLCYLLSIDYLSSQQLGLLS